jgi:hypothetical protein
MARQRNRRFPEVAQPTAFEEARDELFRQIMQCGVIGADPDHQTDWFQDTMAYISDRYPELSTQQLDELRILGDRFVQPPKRAPAEVGSSAA